MHQTDLQNVILSAVKDPLWERGEKRILHFIPDDILEDVHPNVGTLCSTNPPFPRNPMKQLANFTIDIRENDFVLRLVDDEGDVTEFATSVDQLDQVIDAINDLAASGEDE